MIRLAAIRLAFLLLAGTIAAPAWSSWGTHQSCRAHRNRAPAAFKVKFDTSKGPFVVEVHRDWAPLGADRFYNLVNNGFFNNARFFRCDLRLHGAVRHQCRSVLKVSAVWRDANISDDPVKQSNTRGIDHLRNARAPIPGPRRCSSTTLTTNRLDGMGFAPFGQVVSGMNVVDAALQRL